MNVRSARLRLTTWYAAIFGVVLLILGVAVFVALTWALDQQIDAGIEAAAQQWIESTPDFAALPALPVDRDRDHNHDSTDAFVVAIRRDATLVANPSRIDAHELFEHASIDPSSRVRSATTVRLDHERVRLHVLPVLGDRGVEGVVVGARSLHERDEQVRAIVIVLGVVAAGGLALGVGAGYIFAGRALRPLAEAHRRQQQFVADASHELRAPLTVIRTSADLLLCEPTLDAGVRDAVTQIQDVTAEAGRLVEQLLQLARMEAGPEDVAPTSVELATVVRRELDRFAPQLTAHRSALDARLGPVEAAISADEVARVVRALLENVIAHTPEGTAVEVETREADGRALLVVADAGGGVAPNDLAAIFERFTRSDSARTPGTGTGLGLAIVKAIAARRGGRVDASRSSAGGLRVEFAVPLA